jgi:N-acetylglucosamine malate deacetylase 1
MKHRLKKFLASMLVDTLKARQFTALYRLYSAVQFRPLPFTPPQEASRVLVLSPHPDDETFGCGALLNQFSKQCTVYCLTDGRYGNLEEAWQTVKATRSLEFDCAMERAGVYEYQRFDFIDGKLFDYQKQFDAMVNLEAFDTLFLPNPLDQHQDHKAVFWLLQQHLRKNASNINPALQVGFYEVWSALPIVSHYCAMDEVQMGQKKGLMANYKSQVHFHDYAVKITGLNQYRGMLHKHAYAEAYFILPVKEFMEIVL